MDSHIVDIVLQMAQITRTDRDVSVDNFELDNFRAAVFRSAKIGDYVMIYTGVKDETGQYLDQNTIIVETVAFAEHMSSTKTNQCDSSLQRGSPGECRHWATT